ncbi:MAG: response regulator transcription factor [Actinomycetales bacterium]|nr:response regulator transcription factor [Actinomycetales bacterium]
MSRPRVFLVDDHELIRSGIKAEIADAVDIVGDADEVVAATEMIIERRPDVVLLDVHMPDGGGLRVLRDVRASCTDVRFLALSVSDAAEDVIAVVQAGASGYVTKNISGADLIEAIERIRAGDAVFSPMLAGFVLEAFASGTTSSAASSTGDPDLDQLTARERQVLRLIARGYTYKEAGVELGISSRTVETHVSSVLHKLQLSNRHQLSNWANERRLT